MRSVRRVDRYEILRELGRGGMATVYLSRQTDLDRYVALKELGAFHASDPSYAQRFLRESRVAGSLNHPNIVTVFDYFEHDGTPYIAMEYVERGSLRPFVGHMTLAQIGGMFEGLLAGLAHGEEQGIVHRDIKPENVMVTGDGQVKITDFGIAKATSKMQTGAFLTATGTTVGTPVYMAPEQAMAQDIGPWTDLYSVGCMAFELFTGNVPFHDSEAPMAILLRHVNEPIPPIHSIDSSVGEDISDWVERLLVKDPTERTQSAVAAWDDLEDILIGRLGPRWRREARLDQPVDGAQEARAEAAPLETPPSVARTEAPRVAAPQEPQAEPAPEEPEAEAAPKELESDEFQSFAWDGGLDTVAPPGPFTPPPAPEAAIPEPIEVGPPTPIPPPPVAAPIDTGAFVRPPQPPPLPAPLRGTPFETPLIDSFQYLHGPLAHDEGGVSLLGNRSIVDTLKERLLHSRGGSFLITGFRGVGKTTIVLRALEELQAESEDALEYLPIVLSVARPMTVDQLLFEVVRRLFEALTDTGVLDTLEPDVRQALLLAYARTSLAFKETSSRTRESSQSLSLDIGRLGVAGAAMSIVSPKVGVSRKRADTMAREASFLAYSHADVEHDFLRILSLLETVGGLRPRRFRIRPRRPPWRGRLVVVLDELDKLTSTPEGVQAVDDLLMGLKNLLTARNVHFVFVGGPELHDAFMRDVARGNSVYESVFACHIYVPCLWQASEKLVGEVVDLTDSQDSDGLAGLIEYFSFKSRGIPRLLLRELNSLVRWDGGRPAIAVGELDAARVEFYADIQRAVTEFVETAIDREFLSMPIDEDRWRLGAYYITDWILRRGTAEFTVADILSDDATANPLMHASADRVEKLIRHLQAHRIVEKVWYNDARHTMIGDAQQVNSYRLAPSVVSQLASFARRNELERAELGGATGPSADSSGGAAPLAWMTSLGVSRLRQGRYELGDLIGVGGVGRVYRAFDRGLNREVAIKMLAPHLLDDSAVRGRWRREAEIATQLRHEHIVRTYDVVDDAGAAGIVMELIDGPSLRDVLPLRTPAAVAVAEQLLSALDCAQDFGLARFDMKPENVVFRDSRHAVIVDLGLVKHTEPASGEFQTMIHSRKGPPLLGTPAYMSPEQAMGGPVDIRSDLYCVGLVLYETIVGRHLRDLRGSSDEILAQAVSHPPVLDELEVSDELRAVLTRALAVSPEDRFPSPQQMMQALGETPEGIVGAALEDNELLLPRNAPPAKGRMAVLPSIRDDA
jgi:serine/threonine-protein kinase